MSQALIETKALSKKFDDKDILNRVDLIIEKGKNLAIIGGSGQGKSVLLKCIVGLIEPDSGQIFFKGSLLTKKDKRLLMNSFGILFQGAALFDSMPIWENISFQFKYTGALSSKERRHLANQKLELVGLPKSTADRFPSELSGGMQKRVGIARAIAAEPKILFFDEPTSGLDPIMSNTINNLIKGVVKELGSTAVTISHDLKSIRAIADNVALLHEGSIDWCGTIQEFELTSNVNIKEFIEPATTKR